MEIVPPKSVEGDRPDRVEVQLNTFVNRFRNKRVLGETIQRFQLDQPPLALIVDQFADLLDAQNLPDTTLVNVQLNDLPDQERVDKVLAYILDRTVEDSPGVRTGAHLRREEAVR